MKTIGFLISHKNGEGRRALLPEHIGKIKNADKLYFETGYGEAVGVSDEEYAACGCDLGEDCDDLAALTSRMDEYMDEFEANGVENLTLDV